MNRLPLGPICLFCIAIGLVGWTAYSFITSPPDHEVYEMGAFHCDRSWRLPCDGG